MCPFYNCSMNGVNSFMIYCKSMNFDKKVVFKTEEQVQKYFNSNCSEECRQCSHYKILRAKELHRGN